MFMNSASGQEEYHTVSACMEIDRQTGGGEGGGGADKESAVSESLQLPILTQGKGVARAQEARVLLLSRIFFFHQTQ